VTIELQGIELFAFHGVLEEERRDGQRFLVDIELDGRDGVAGATDRIEDAIDYRDVVAAVVEVSDARAYHLLEAFATALAETLVGRFPVTRARVRVRKPDVVLPRPVDHAAIVVERRS
jgi:dihydroneopterin aldolase